MITLALLETISYKTDDELNKYGFADDSRDRNKLREKYAGKELSFQSVSSLCKNLYQLNAFEKIEIPDESKKKEEVKVTKDDISYKPDTFRRMLHSLY